MPIANMQVRRFPRLGKLRKGAPKPQGRPGQDLNYFRVEFEPQFAHLEPLFKDLYGEKPKQFDWVLVMGNTPDEAFPTWKKEYQSNGVLLRQCDGVSQHLHLESNGQYSDTQIPCLAPNCKCSKQTGTLNLMLLDFCKDAGVMGTFQLVTNSINDIQRVLGSLQSIYDIRGSVYGVPFVFGREETKISTAEIKDRKPTGNRMMVTKSLLYLHPNPEFFRNKIMPMLMGMVDPSLPVMNQNMLEEPKQFLSKEQFASEIAARNLTTDIAMEIVRKAGVNTEGDDRYSKALDAIDQYLDSMPVIENEIAEDLETTETE